MHTCTLLLKFVKNWIYPQQFVKAGDRRQNLSVTCYVEKSMRVLFFEYAAEISNPRQEVKMNV